MAWESIYIASPPSIDGWQYNASSVLCVVGIARS